MSGFDREHQQSIVDTFDPRDPGAEFYRNPYPVYRALRELSPVHRCPDGTIFITRHADANHIYRDPKTFSSAKDKQFKPLFGDSPLFDHHTTSLVFNDPPLHTNVRKAIGDALAPKVVASMEPQLATLVDRLLDELPHNETFDFMDRFASVIPIEVIGNLLDIDERDRGPLRDWSYAILGALEFGLTDEAREAGNRAVEEFVAFLKALIGARRRNPSGDDIITRLIRWESADYELTEHQIYHQCIFLLNAGHETTTNLIGNAVYELLRRPVERAAVSENEKLIGAAVEEFLRFEAPVQLGNRLTTRAIQIGDHHLDSGTTITLCIGGANRDPAVFADPDTLKLDREPNPHLAFAGGIHSCAGMAVARLEARVALSKLLRRYPNLEADGEAHRAQRARFRGFIRFPVRINAV